MKISMTSNSTNFVEFWKQHKNIVVEALRPHNINNESYPLRVRLDMNSIGKDSPLIPIILELQDELGYLLEDVHKIIPLLPQEQIMGILRKYIPMGEGDSLVAHSLSDIFETNTQLECSSVFNTLFRSKNLEAIEFMLQSQYIQKYCIGGCGLKINLQLDNNDWDEWERRLWGKLKMPSQLTWSNEYNSDFANYYDEYYTQQLKVIGVDINTFHTFFTIPNHFDWEMFEEAVKVIKTMIHESINKVMTKCVQELNKQGIWIFQLSPLGVFDNNGKFYNLRYTEILRYLRPNTYAFHELTQQLCQEGFEKMLEKLS